MKKIMFNDKFGLTQAVLSGRKTMTRRIIKFDKLGEFTFTNALKYDWGKRLYKPLLAKKRDTRSARFANDALLVYTGSPTIDMCYGELGINKGMYYLDETSFPSVTFENSPKKVKVTIELEDEV